MALEFRGMIISILLIGLFVFAMFSGGVFLASENHANVTLSKDASLNSMYTNLSYDLNNSANIANDVRKAFEKENPLITAVLLFKSVIYGGIQFTSLVVSIMGYMFGSIIETIGVGAIVISVISAIVLIILVFSAWRVYQAGS